MKLKLVYTFTILLMFVSAKSFAFVFTLTEQQLNTMLVVGFPIKQSYQGIDVTFSSPYVTLDSVDKKVRISTTILATKAEQSLRAKGTVEGVVAYNSKTQELQFEKPTLIDFAVIDNQLENSDVVIQTIKQNIGNNLPLILLVDFKQFDLGFGDIVPKDIKITPRGLAITL